MKTHEHTTSRDHPRTTHSNPPNPLTFFFDLAEIWDLNTDQQMKLLGSPARSTYFRWRKDGGEVSTDVLERISHLGSIYKALMILLDTPESAVKWLRKPNRYFDGATALDILLNGTLTDIIKVRHYVDAQRGG
jgi:uncharacterized protein (DUF2384 family)